VEAEKVLTVNQVAARLQVNVQTVRRWLRQGDLIGTPLGGRSGWRVSESEVQGFLDRRRMDARETGKAADRSFMTP
jgi:excisionase family DNA binding protein